MGGLLILSLLILNRALAISFVSIWLVCFLFAESLRALKRRGEEDGLISFVSELLSNPARTPLEERFFAPTFFALVAWLLVIGFTPLDVATCSIFVFSFADPMAALIGTRFGYHRWAHNLNKSLEGSLAFFSISILPLSLVSNPLAAPLIAFTLALFESMPLEISDNLIIPLLAAMLLLGLSHGF
jgi:dolichol kinase